MSEYTTPRKPRKETVLIVELDKHYSVQFHMFAVGHPTPVACKFAGRYEYPLCDVVVYARPQIQLHPAEARQIADHHYDQFLATRDNDRRVDNDYFSF